MVQPRVRRARQNAHRQARIPRNINPETARARIQTRQRAGGCIAAD
ncbi:hypothetical protein [Acetobacter aceti]|nr:hypothetical protein [Acetobacter aceti]